MPIECEVISQPEGLHLAQEDRIVDSFAVNTGEAIVLFNHTESRQKDIRLLQCDMDEARIYAVNPQAIIAVLSRDGSISARLVDRESTDDFSQIRMVTLEKDKEPWQTHILDSRGKFTGKIFRAWFI